MQYGVKLLSAIVIFFSGKWLSRVFSDPVKRAMTRAGTEVALVSFVGSITYMLLLAFTIVAALGHLGIQTASLPSSAPMDWRSALRCKVLCRTSPPAWC